jgi:KUP system potassium uptake protein
VYGDLATSPLYTFSAIFSEQPTEIDNLGALSLIIYSIISIVTIKYALFVLQVDNEGEGGILALTALLPDYKWEDGRAKYIGKECCVFLSIVGAAFVLGDSVITPPISVLSAIEGIGAGNETMQQAVVPITIAILIALFAFQRFGTAKVGLLFGPVLLLWCIAIASIGIYNISLNPASFKAFNPLYVIYLFQNRGAAAVRMFAGVVLALTGCEAMYADLGHFGKGPIRVSWLLVVQPAVILCYMGQSSHLLNEPKNWESAFYNSTPSPIYWPMVILATVSTIIASQAMITGAFSLVSQASQLDYFPKLKIYHTSTQHEGQIYIPAVNWTLMIGCILLTVLFKSSANLADAFGLAVCGVLVITTILYVAAVLVTWQKHIGIKLAFLIPFTIAFLPVLIFFFMANLVKFFTGGWIPLAIGLVCFFVMLIWKLGLAHFRKHVGEDNHMSFDEFAEKTAHITRVKGIGVFYSHAKNGVPTYIRKHVQLFSILPERIVFLNIKFYKVPFVKEELRASVRTLSKNTYLVTIRYGFMEAGDMNVPEVIRQANMVMDEDLRKSSPTSKSPDDIDEKVVIDHQFKIFDDLGLVETTTEGLPIIYFVPGYYLKPDQTKWFWRRYALALFIFMKRNSLSEIQGWKLPHDSIIELGTVTVI